MFHVSFNYTSYAHKIAKTPEPWIWDLQELWIWDLQELWMQYKACCLNVKYQ